MSTATAALAADSLTDDQYELAHRILTALCDRGDRKGYTASEMARMKGVKSDADAVRRVLPALIQDGNLTGDDRGAWTRYTFVYG